MGRVLTIGLLLTTMVLSACAGFRGGWMSVPYVGDATRAPQTKPLEGYEAHAPRYLPMNGFELRVELNNQLRTYDNQVMLFVVPTGIDPRNVYTQNHQPGKTRVLMSIRAVQTALVIDLSNVYLEVDGQEVAASAVIQFGQWDEQGNRVEKGGKWGERPYVGLLSLKPGVESPSLVLEFDRPLPSPENTTTALDFGRAMPAGGPTQPKIRFQPVRWKEGYT